MNSEIHGALVGGALGGAVVYTGIWLEAAASSRRNRVERRHRLLLQGTDAVNRARPLICQGGIMAVSPGSAQGQEAISEVQKVFDLGLDLYHSTRTTDRRGRKIRAEARDFVARWRAAVDACKNGTPYTLDELNHIDLTGLRKAVWGEREGADIEALTKHYLDNGFGAKPSKTT